MKNRSAKKERQTHIERHPILDEVAIKGYRLRNKAVVAPMSRVSANGNGVPTMNMTRYYAQYASGGFGLAPVSRPAGCPCWPDAHDVGQLHERV